VDKEHKLLKAQFLASIQRTTRKVDKSVLKTRLFCQKEEEQVLDNEDLDTPAKQGGKDEKQQVRSQL
jgi:hypothetical protein